MTEAELRWYLCDMDTPNRQIEKLLYTRPETAEALGISLSSLLRREADGTLRSVRIGGRVMFSVAELRRLAGVTA